MAKEEIKFAVGSEDDLRSSIWQLWVNTNKNDVYLGARMFRGQIKISLHEVWCRIAELSDVPRPAMHKWRRPTPQIPGFTRLFSIVVPPYLVDGAFHQRWTEDGPIKIVPPPADPKERITFSIAVTSKEYSEDDLKHLPGPYPLTIIKNLRLRTGICWVYYYYDPLNEKTRVLLRDYVAGFRMHLNPGDPLDNRRSANLFWFDTSHINPHVVDIRLGTENETLDPPPKDRLR